MSDEKYRFITADGLGFGQMVQVQFAGADRQLDPIEQVLLAVADERDKLKAELATLSEIHSKVSRNARSTAELSAAEGVGGGGEKGNKIMLIDDRVPPPPRAEPDGIVALVAAIQQQKWPQTMSALEWKNQWMERIKKDPSIATDEGAMLAWFANAIMAGFYTAQFGNGRVREIERARNEALEEAARECEKASMNSEMTAGAYYHCITRIRALKVVAPKP